MDFLTRLEKLSKEKGISNNYKLSELSGIPYTTIDNFYRKGYENVKLSTLKKLADFFQCSLDYITCEESSIDTHPPTQKVQTLVTNYDKLNDTGQDYIDDQMMFALSQPKYKDMVIHEGDDLRTIGQVLGSIE